MLTVLELINAIEAKRGDYDDPVAVFHVVGGYRGDQRFRVVGVDYTAGGEDGCGELEILVAVEPQNSELPG